MSSASIAHSFASLDNSKFFSLLDMKAAFNQIKLSEDSKHVTAIVTQYGMFQYEFVPYEISVSSQSLARFLNSNFSEFCHNLLLIHYEDLIVHSPDIDSHLNHLNLLFTKMEYIGIIKNPTKATFCMSRIRLLGSATSAEGHFIDLLKVHQVNDMPLPKNMKEVSR